MAQELSLDTLNLLEQQSVDTTLLFQEQKLTAQQIVQIDTRQLPARVIAFQLYGSSTLGATIAELNDEINVSFLEGTIDVLTA